MASTDRTITPEAVKTPLTPYQRKLLAFLGVAIFFEGFDYIALTQLLPNLRREFGLSEGEGGHLVGVIGVGAVLSYFLIRQADVVGRRKILGITIIGYTCFSVLSAITGNAWQFGVAQLMARVFLLAEYAVSMVYVVEEFPADRRAFAVGMLQGLNSLGSIVCAGVVPLLLRTPWQWRAVYVVGAVPLLLIAWLRRDVRETTRFSEQKVEGPAPMLRIFRSPHRKRIPLLAAIWGLTYLCTYIVITFWKEFAIAERGFDDAQVARALMIAALGSLPLVFFSGKLLDVVGRKPGATVIFVTASASTLLAYLGHGFWPLTLGLTGGIFAASAVLPVLTTYTLELFPTELRADGFAWSNNVLGRISYVVGPPLIGAAAERYGYGPSVACTALTPLLALLLIVTCLPETKGKELEEASALH